MQIKKKTTQTLVPKVKKAATFKHPRHALREATKCRSFNNNMKQALQSPLLLPRLFSTSWSTFMLFVFASLEFPIHFHAEHSKESRELTLQLQLVWAFTISLNLQSNLSLKRNKEKKKKIPYCTVTLRSIFKNSLPSLSKHLFKGFAVC